MLFARHTSMNIALSNPTDRSARVRSLAQVKAYHDHLLNYQKELEERAARRTRELSQTLEDLGRANDGLKKNSLNTIYCLSRAAEYKDEDTAAHVQRIGEFTRAISRKLGLSEEEQGMLLYATPMHNIGKIGIPDRILLKPRKLDAEEWKMMQQHTVIGAQILAAESNGFLGLVRTISLSHHEKWDGNGYPNGLKREAIPLPARITAVADVFDALSSNRPYKRAFTLEQSVGIITDGRGLHFDPRLVDAFMAVRDEVFAIRHNLEDTGQSITVRLHKDSGCNAADP
jgi:putative two-component system response regulator